MRNATLPQARGSTVRTTLEFVRQSWGEAMVEAILGEFDADDQTALRNAGNTDYVPYELVLSLWRSADVRLAARQPDWVEEAGAFAIASTGQELYGGILLKRSPVEFITQSVSLFQLYYSQGNVQAVEVEANRAVLRLTGFDTLGPLFCRRLAGGLRSATTLAGGRDARVRHVRCVFEGDAYCEWELRWR